MRLHCIASPRYHSSSQITNHRPAFATAAGVLSNLRIIVKSRDIVNDVDQQKHHRHKNARQNQDREQNVVCRLMAEAGS